MNGAFDPRACQLFCSSSIGNRNGFLPRLQHKRFAESISLDFIELGVSDLVRAGVQSNALSADDFGCGEGARECIAERERHRERQL